MLLTCLDEWPVSDTKYHIYLFPPLFYSYTTLFLKNNSDKYLNNEQFNIINNIQKNNGNDIGHKNIQEHSQEINDDKRTNNDTMDIGVYMSF